jgi:hypothetical protein
LFLRQPSKKAIIIDPFASLRFSDTPVADVFALSSVPAGSKEFLERVLKSMRAILEEKVVMDALGEIFARPVSWSEAKKWLLTPTRPGGEGPRGSRFNNSHTIFLF